MKKATNDIQGEVLGKTLEKIRKQFGKDAAIIPSQDIPRSEVRGVLRSGIDVLDRHICGAGGFPYGRITELFSEPGICKTSIGWTLIGSCIRSGGIALHCDNEHSYDGARARLFGVDESRFILIQPWTLEEAMTRMQATLEELDFKGPICLIWDSIAGSQYKGDEAGNYDKSPFDDRAAKIGRFCRAMVSIAVEKQAHLLFINQTRTKRGVLFGNATTTPGGDALKFFASLRIQLFGGKAIKDRNGRHLGKVVTFMAMKSRFSEPFRKARVRLDYMRGWDNLWSTINHAKDMALIGANLKPTKETYAQAIEALGWKDAAEADVLDSSDGIVEEGDGE